MRDKEYIERVAFLRKCAETWGRCGVTIKAIEGIADECAAADVVEVRHGEWILKWRSTLPQYEPNEYECSVCGMKRSVKHNYCPRCGARMDGERKEQT